MMRDHHFRTTKMRFHMTPDFMLRVRAKGLAAELDRQIEAAPVDKDPVEEVAKVFEYVRNNPHSDAARSVTLFLNAFDSKPTEEPVQSVSQRVVRELVNYGQATRLLTLSFIDEVAGQIEGGAPNISSFNDGYDGAVDNVLREKFGEAAAAGHPDAEPSLSVLEASIWARGAAQRANAEVDQTLVALGRSKGFARTFE